MDEESSLDPELFIYVMIPENIQPKVRDRKYEDPLEESLQDKRLGTVSGAGSLLDDPGPDGKPRVAFCGLDIDVTNRAAALKHLRRQLPQLGVPSGTELHYTRRGARLRDRFSRGKWKLAMKRKMLHPGFGI